MMLASNGAGLVEVVIVLVFFAGLWVAAEVLCWMYEHGWWRRGSTMHGETFRSRKPLPRPFDWERDGS